WCPGRCCSRHSVCLSPAAGRLERCVNRGCQTDRIRRPEQRQLGPVGGGEGRWQDSRGWRGRFAARQHQGRSRWLSPSGVGLRGGSGWSGTLTESAKLTASDGQNGDALGSSVAVSADGATVVVGSCFAGAGGTARGAIYVYVRPGGGWVSTATFTAKLTASDG